MKVLIKYIDFHWDNYQGGSGRTVESSYKVDVPDDIRSDSIYEYLHQRLLTYIESRRPFKQQNKHTVVSMELL